MQGTIVTYHLAAEDLAGRSDIDAETLALLAGKGYPAIVVDEYSATTDKEGQEHHEISLHAFCGPFGIVFRPAVTEGREPGHFSRPGSSRAAIMDPTAT